MWPKELMDFWVIGTHTVLTIAISICFCSHFHLSCCSKTKSSSVSNGSAARLCDDTPKGARPPPGAPKLAFVPHDMKITNLMKEHTDFGPLSKFIDVFSGLAGKPNLHVMDDPRVAFSFQSKIEKIFWDLVSQAFI